MRDPWRYVNPEGYQQTTPTWAIPDVTLPEPACQVSVGCSPHTGADKADTQVGYCARIVIGRGPVRIVEYIAKDRDFSHVHAAKGGPLVVRDSQSCGVAER